VSAVPDFDVSWVPDAIGCHTHVHGHAISVEQGDRRWVATLWHNGTKWQGAVEWEKWVEPAARLRAQQMLLRSAIFSAWRLYSLKPGEPMPDEMQVLGG
jgi:hypothetical protein